MKRPVSITLAAYGLVLALCLALNSRIFAGEQFVEVHFALEVSDYLRQAKTNVKRLQYQWPGRCVFGQDRWGMAIDSGMNARVHYYYDGTNVYRRYEVTKALPPPSSKPRLKYSLPSPDDPRVFSAIIPGEHPLAGLGENLAWLAYCSSSYLDRDRRVIPLSGCEIRETPEAFAYSDETITFTDALGLPKTVELRTSRALAQLSPLDPRLSRGYNVAPYRRRPTTNAKDGLLKCRYEVIASTNFLGWNIPTRFEYVQYRQAGTTNVQVSVSCQAVFVNTAPPPTNVLLASPEQSIQDYRFRDKEKLVDSIDYVWTNSSVPDPAMGLLQARFESSRNRAPKDPFRKVPIRRYLVISIVLLGLAPIFLICLRNRNKTTTKEE